MNIFPRKKSESAMPFQAPNENLGSELTLLALSALKDVKGVIAAGQEGGPSSYGYSAKGHVVVKNSLEQMEQAIPQNSPASQAHK